MSLIALFFELFVAACIVCDRRYEWFRIRYANEVYICQKERIKRGLVTACRLFWFVLLSFVSVVIVYVALMDHFNTWRNRFFLCERY